MTNLRELRSGKREAGTWTAALLAMLIGLALPAAVWAQDAEPDLGTEAQREAGRAVYDQKCAQCHGPDGAGDGIATPYVRPAPRDFTGGIFKFRSTQSGELPTTEDIRRSIREGMPYTSMPAWKGILSEQQITNLAYYLKTFTDDFSGPYGVPEEAVIPRPPGFDEGHLARGREVFMENQCADCHGDQGRGDGPSAPTLEDQWGFHIRPADLTKRWTFRNGQTRQDIYRTFTTGLDGSPMPSYDMPEEDRWALVDYVWSLSRDEAGYDQLALAAPVPEVDLSRGEALFAEAQPAYFPVVGQIIDPGRSFYPGVNGVELKAVYDDDDVAFLVIWHDMTAETSGRNHPTMDAPDDPAAVDSAGTFSDAIALQFPETVRPGVEKPYFLFGDAKNPVHLWHADLAADGATVLTGRGQDDIQPTDGAAVEMTARYEDGRWVALFRAPRLPEAGPRFEEETFVPVAVSVWDGFYRERGPKRGITSWYSVYVEPAQTQSAAIPMAKWALIVLLGELLVVGLVRWRAKRRRETVVA